MVEGYLRYLFSIKSILTKAILLALMFLHGKTKYYTYASSLKDMFYWPEGICADMFVVAGIFTMIVYIAWLETSVFIKLSNKTIEKFLEDINNIDDDDF